MTKAEQAFNEVSRMDKRILIAGGLRACMCLLARAAADAHAVTLGELEEKLHRQAGELAKLLREVA